MPQSLVDVRVHLIFSTKNREPHITPDLRDRLFAYMGAVWCETGGKPILINGPADHVHVLATLSSTKSVADSVRVLKSNTSKWVHETFPAKAVFAWQSGYAAFAVAGSTEPAVRRYIANQEEHHKRVTFQQEYRRFLERHGAKYDERYVWD